MLEEKTHLKDEHIQMLEEQAIATEEEHEDDIKKISWLVQMLFILTGAAKAKLSGVLRPRRPD